LTQSEKTPKESPPELKVLAVSRRGDGRHRVLRQKKGDRFIVVKGYGRKRSRIRTWLRAFGSRVIVHKSSVSPTGRCRTERDVLALWRREGFDVPRILDAEPTCPVPEPRLVMEWIEGPLFSQVLGDVQVSLARKRSLVQRFARQWGERHARALLLKEPRLLFEHPTFDHVILCGERMVHLDFEIVFTSRHNLDRLIRRELVGFLRSMVKSSKTEFGDLLNVLVSSYPDRASLERVRDELLAFGTVPVLKWMAPLTRILKSHKRYHKRSLLIRELQRVL
jgi:tRNA A-37 threonylcarbamoyl transferase component Bud32